MPYIIGTAGHIDHGKTSLIKALTGLDTDRLKEEKERGISIDLGFAHLDLPDGTSAGIVDVPGHERFIKNMLAGAHGIDLVLFTVAADDGVMPQTEEHLDIVHLLGVKMAIFVITKADLVPPSRIAEVGEEIDILTLGTVLENSPKIAVSSATGQGIAELKERIAEILKGQNRKPPSGYFRLPVDRAFILQGHGVVVTGTGLSGEVKVGEQVRCLPGNHMFRVRSLQVHGKSVDSAGWGQRVAMNLTGPDRAEIARGHVICHEKIHLVTDRFDAHLEVRPGARKGLKNHQRVRVHLGAAERLGKIVILGAAEKIEPKESAFCQITISEPLLALRSDHFILRDETARRTLAGGIVINPWANRHRRGESQLQNRLDALLQGDTAALTEAYIESSAAFALPIDAIYQFLNVREEQIGDVIEKMKHLRVLSAEGERLYTTQEKWQRVKEQMLGLLKTFHAGHPLLPGMDMEELRGKLLYALSPKIFRVVTDTLINEKLIAREENLLRLAGHRVQLGGQEKTLMDKIKNLLGEQPLAPPDLKEIEKQAGVPRNRINEVIRLLEREGAVVRITTDMYFLASSIEQLRQTLRNYLTDKGEMTAASFRDLIGSSRKYIIPLLEFFDRDGLTIRIGDIRRLKAAPGEKRTT
ncbi:MAG TPA: selenocysteine-specific translation elongation factor [Candidatus Binatia bacterium]|jgi:selenocysteine-specific elongation factor|nr:selenocysteine-specific translation elongation factor [Candidatus Binatia bacterium]